MVKVIGISKEEEEEKNRFKRLESIAREKLPAFYFNTSNAGLILKEKLLGSMTINPHVNLISVYDSQLLETAIDLAKAYEESGESEFTVKKRYRE